MLSSRIQSQHWDEGHTGKDFLVVDTRQYSYGSPCSPSLEEWGIQEPSTILHPTVETQETNYVLNKKTKIIFEINSVFVKGKF